MATTPNSTSSSSSRLRSGSRNSRVARRTTRSPRANPYSIPALAARLSQHERRFREMDIELQETRENWRLTALERIHQVTEDHENTVANMDILHDQVTANRNEISTLQSRLEQSDTRLRQAEDHARMLEQLLEEAIRLIVRLNGNMERVATLLPPPIPPRD